MMTTLRGCSAAKISSHFTEAAFTLQNKRQSCVKFAVFHNIFSTNRTEQIQEESLANLRWLKKKEIEGESRFFSSLKTLLMTKTTNRIFLCRRTNRTEASLSGVSSYFVHPLYIVWLVLWYCRKNCFSSFGSVTTTTTKRNHSFQLES